jgi:hypothetical protein
MSNITHDFWLWAHKIVLCFSVSLTIQGRMQDFKLGGAHLKKLRRAGGGAKISGVFRVKNHDFTPKNHIFSNFRALPERPPGSAPADTICLATGKMVF